MEEADARPSALTKDEASHKQSASRDFDRLVDEQYARDRPRTEVCLTCGSDVDVVSSMEGTSHFQPTEKRWQRMRQVPVDDTLQDIHGEFQPDYPIREVWQNDLYEVQVFYVEPDRGRMGAVHLSIKLFSRDPITDWRHKQSIKNEVIGYEREAMELYPAESRLWDAANQTHLWVMRAGDKLPFGVQERAVATQQESERNLRKRGMRFGKGRQRPWQPGLMTGRELDKRKKPT